MRIVQRVPPTSKWVGKACRQCHRNIQPGDDVAGHGLGRDAPVDIRTILFHASCLAGVIFDSDVVSPPPRPGSKAAKAAAFRSVQGRVLAGGPVFVDANN